MARVRYVFLSINSCGTSLLLTLADFGISRQKKGYFLENKLFCKLINWKKIVHDA